MGIHNICFICFIVKYGNLSLNWAAAWQNQQNDLCTQRRLGSAWASALSDQSSLSTWRNLGSLASQMSGQQRLWSEWVDAQADLSLRWAHRSFCWFCHAAAQIYLNLFMLTGLVYPGFVNWVCPFQTFGFYFIIFVQKFLYFLQTW